jgi:regulator of RNase E activity RraA
VGFATIGHLIEYGAADPEIRAVVEPVKLAGRAITVRIMPPDSTLVHKATEMLEPGDVLVIDTGGDRRHAPAGGMVALAAHQRGALGIVVDGVCTDRAELRALGFPVFARGTSLLTTKLLGIPSGALNLPISCGGVVVYPGDLVLADENGVLFLRPSVAAALLPEVEAHERQSEERRQRLLEGASLAELSGANATLARLLGQPASEPRR